MTKILLLAAGGATGTIARYAVGRWVNEQVWARGLPWGTLIINVTGSFILAAAAVIILEKLPPARQDWFLLVGTGFCGAYTTFSTFEWETFLLLRDGSWRMALANVAASVAAGMLGVILAVILAHQLFPQR